MSAKQNNLIAAAREMIKAYGNCGSLRQQTAADNLQKAINEAATPRGEQEEKYFEAAKNEWHRDGEIEIDDDAEVSVSDDNGAYVQAWVWVDDSDEGEDPK